MKTFEELIHTNKKPIKELVEVSYRITTGKLKNQSFVTTNGHGVRLIESEIAENGDNLTVNLKIYRCELVRVGKEVVTGKRQYIASQSTRLERFKTGYGSRLYFLCPRCGQRMATLYLKPAGRSFMCRGCNQLVYELQTIDRHSRFGSIAYSLNRITTAKNKASDCGMLYYGDKPTRKAQSFKRLVLKHNIDPGEIKLGGRQP